MYAHLARANIVVGVRILLKATNAHVMEILKEARALVGIMQSL